MNPRPITVLLFAISLSCLAKPKTVKNPWFDVSTEPQFAIERVELSDTATVLHCAYHSRKGRWFRISQSSFLAAGGKKMRLKGAEGIAPGKKTYVDSTLIHRHRLVFPPMPPDTKTFDFIEDYDKGAFQVWGVRLDKKKPRPATPIVPAAGTAAKALPVPQWRLGSTTVSGRIYGYRPEMNIKAVIYPNNAFDRNSTEVSAEPDDNGSFTLSVPMHTTCQTVTMRLGPWYGRMVLSQDAGSEVYIDLVEESHRYTPGEYSMRISDTMSPDLIRPRFAGAMADVNNELGTPEVREVIWNSFGNNKANRPDKKRLLTAREHAGRVMAWTERNYRIADSVCKNEKTRQVVRTIIKYYLASDLQFKHNHVRRDSDNRPQFDPIVFDLYRKAGLNSMMMAYCGAFRQVANRIEYIPYDNPDFTNSLRAIARRLATAGVPQDSINTAVEKRQQEYRDSVFGYTEGPVNDLIYSYRISNILDKDTPLGGKEMASLKAHPNKTLAEYYLKDNGRLAAELARRAESGLYTIHSVSDTIGGMAFVESLSRQYPGRKILVDFWGTWCGPCRNAIKMFEPKKKDLKERGIVFVYVTDDKSPESEWRNMASGMEGGHYRLTDTQTREIYSNFQFSGWPSYLIIDTDGKYIYHRTGYMEKAMIDKLKE